MKRRLLNLLTALSLLAFLHSVGCAGARQSADKPRHVAPADWPEDLARQLRNEDVEWSGPMFGLRPTLVTPAAKELMASGPAGVPSLLDALNDPDQYAVAHVVLTAIANEPRRETEPAARWNGLRVELHADGRVELDASDMPTLAERWRNWARRRGYVSAAHVGGARAWADDTPSNAPAGPIGVPDDPAARRAPPVVYAPEDQLAPRSPPLALTPEQLDAVLKAAEEHERQRPIWFVLVLNHSRGWLLGESLTAAVYFQPDESAERLRKGQYCIVRRARSGGRAVGLFPYAQVSPPGTTFGRHLGVPDLTYIPISHPFVKPPPLVQTDADLVAAVDAARDGLRTDEDVPDEWRLEPVRRLEQSDGVIEVFHGWGGGGVLTFLKRNGAGFEYAGYSAWAE